MLKRIARLVSGVPVDELLVVSILVCTVLALFAELPNDLVRPGFISLILVDAARFFVPYITSFLLMGLLLIKAKSNWVDRL